MQQVKDVEFAARCIFITPLASGILETRLKANGLGDEQIQETVKTASELSEHSATPGFYDSVVDCDLKALESSIFGTALNGVETSNEPATGDVAMEDAEPKTT